MRKKTQFFTYKLSPILRQYNTPGYLVHSGVAIQPLISASVTDKPFPGFTTTVKQATSIRELWTHLVATSPFSRLHSCSLTWNALRVIGFDHFLPSVAWWTDRQPMICLTDTRTWRLHLDRLMFSTNKILTNRILSRNSLTPSEEAAYFAFFLRLRWEEDGYCHSRHDTLSLYLQPLRKASLVSAGL